MWLILLFSVGKTLSPHHRWEGATPSITRMQTWMKTRMQIARMQTWMQACKDNWGVLTHILNDRKTFKTNYLFVAIFLNYLSLSFLFIICKIQFFSACQTSASAAKAWNQLDFFVFFYNLQSSRFSSSILAFKPLQEMRHCHIQSLNCLHCLFCPYCLSVLSIL